MYIEEYKKELENWKKDHTNFYDECLHAMKNHKATLGAYMHIYDYAMSELPNLPGQVELGACEDLFMIYHEKSGFNGMAGMLNLLCYYDKFFYAKCLLQKEKLKKALLTWLVIGDLHTCIINKTVRHPNKDDYEEGLRKLQYRLIGNSLITELKNADYWSSQRIFDKLLLSKDELKECLDRYASTFPKASKENQQSTNKRGRKTKFDGLKENTLEAFIEYSTGSCNNVDAYVKKIVQQLELCTTGEDLAALTIALEYCKIIKCVDNGGVKMFWEILHKKNTNIVGYETMNDSYKGLFSFHNNGKVPLKFASGRKKILEYIKIFQETKNEHDNGVQETSIEAN